MFAVGSDPVVLGLVSNLNRPNRPEGNITGVTFFAGALGPKRFELLRELVPKAATIALLVNPNTAASVFESSSIQWQPPPFDSRSRSITPPRTATSTELSRRLYNVG